MNFTIETTDIDLGDTPIENIFINDFMPMANGTYVKVYLLGYKYAHDKDENIEVNNETIAKHLNIPLIDVLSAWDFWEGKGIIEKMPVNSEDKYDYKVKFLNLKQLYIKNNYKPIDMSEEAITKNYTCSVEDLVGANQIPRINEMFNSIDYIMRRQLVPNEKRKVLEWVHNYNMNPDIIEKAFFHAVEKKGKRNINYVAGIVRNWYDQGITNVEALQEHLKATDEKHYRYERIMKALGIGGRLPTEGEMKVIDKWFEEYKFTMEIVLKGCENSKKTSNPSVNYIDGVLSSWYEKGIKSLEDIEEKDIRPPKKEQGYKRTERRTRTSKNKFHNFEQRTSNYSAEQLEDIARRKREEYYSKYSKIKGELNDV
ncbi:DnaD domain-containing protein [Clostridium sp. Cult3]|uniref:DnaD domain-containing protein n=1 Tax=Clostridium sp. Cult3 TaxID=2079004 RepID=UPI001F231C0A|nr:DnaD domain protein [Clostridium sp. Cult3]MCF6460959.1 primosomal replication protein N [Clostridium sp. Cult3]